jgi:methylmalonyl-CoA/ethylmalonyl-CoA epimerase
MIVGLDHIAIAVPDLDAALARWSSELGLRHEGNEDVPSQKTRTAFLAIGDTHVELVTPLSGEGPIRDALDERGPGLHHLCFRSDDLDGDVARLRGAGWRFTTDAPTPGAHGSRVIFVHPKSTGGVLIEIVEPGDAPHRP